MHRRQFLGLVAAGLAGCAGLGGGPGERELARIGIASCTDHTARNPSHSTN